MINHSNAKLESLIIHKVGNKLNDDGYSLSETTSEKVSKEVAGLLVNYFLSPFRNSELYSFWHESDLDLNACYSFVREIFKNQKSFVSKSKNVAKHLYEQSVHPRIKSGELYISYLTNVIIDDQAVDAIGIFKSESKETFLQIRKASDHFDLRAEEGVNINKVDKACLVLNLDQDNGFKVCVIDNANKNDEAQYWKDLFLKVKPLSDNYHFTKNFLSATKDFITNRLPTDFEVEKTDQIEFLNKSVNYFREKETFNIKEFEKDVFDNPDIIRSFRKFGSSYVDQNDIDIADTFEISTEAVKKQERIFKSVLKLDKNFHVYIHGRTDLLEKGYDNKKGKSYYKIYFDEEL